MGVSRYFTFLQSVWRQSQFAVEHGRVIIAECQPRNQLRGLLAVQRTGNGKYTSREHDFSKEHSPAKSVAVGCNSSLCGRKRAFPEAGKRRKPEST